MIHSDCLPCGWKKCCLKAHRGFDPSITSGVYSCILMLANQRHMSFCWYQLNKLACLLNLIWFSVSLIEFRLFIAELSRGIQYTIVYMSCITLIIYFPNCLVLKNAFETSICLIFLAQNIFSNLHPNLQSKKIHNKNKNKTFVHFLDTLGIVCSIWFTLFK